MSKTPNMTPEEIRYPEQRIVESPLVPEMEQSQVEYARSRGPRPWPAATTWMPRTSSHP